jgi:outer membrane lipoprotein-sorting protein
MKKLLLSLLLLSFTVHANMTGRDIMEKIKANNEGYVGSTSKMTMVLIDAHGNKVERILTGKVLENLKEGDKSITAFEKPLDVKGTKLLTWTSKQGENQQWLYLPKFKRVKKINAQNQDGSFMGSEFSYEDIAGQEIEKYNYKLLSETDSEWVVESTPKASSGYSKLVTTISKAKMNPIKVQYFDRKGELLKISILEDFKQFQVNKKNFDLANKITMENIQTKRKSVIEWNERKLGEKLSDNDFKATKLE